MKFRLALSALTVAAVAAGAPMLAAAQTPPSSGNVVASTPVPNPPEKAPAKSVHKVTHHRKTKVSHRRHKAAASAPAKTASAKPAKKGESMKMASGKTTSTKTTTTKK